MSRPDKPPLGPTSDEAPRPSVSVDAFTALDGETSETPALAPAAPVAPRPPVEGPPAAVTDPAVAVGVGSTWRVKTDLEPQSDERPRVEAEGLRETDERSVTVKLDPEQQDELMRLRAQQDQALKERAGRDVVVMFSDMVGSTAYYERHGDMAGRQKLLTHNALLFPIIRDHAGTVVKTIGDGIMACFNDARAAVHAAVEIQVRLEGHNRAVASADDAIQVRIGLNGGRALFEGADLHGDVVNVASRIEAHAAAGEILVAESLLGGLADLPVQPLGPVTLKGKREPVRLCRVRWREDTAPTGDELLSLPGPLAERFRVVGVVGMSSIGVTYLAVPKPDGAPVFVKVLYSFVTRSEPARRRFLDQLWASTRLAHPGIARVLEYSAAEDGRAFYLTEYVEGEDLRQRVERRGPLPVAEVVRIGLELAEALRYAHDQRVVHGDVKPSNVLCARDGTLKLTDFGMVSVWQDTPEHAAEPLSDPTFMAPQVIGGTLVDPRLDVYSLGALLYYLACGRGPLEGEATVATLRALVSGRLRPLARARPDLPRRFVAVIDRATAVVAHRRYASMSELHAALSELGDLEDTSPAAVGPPPEPTRTTEPTLVVVEPTVRRQVLLPPHFWRRPRWLWAALAAGLLLGGTALWASSRRCAGPDAPSSPSRR